MFIPAISKRLALLFATVITLSACAEGGTGERTDSGPSIDMSMANNVNNTADMSSESDDGDGCGVCCPGETTCIDESTQGQCTNSGDQLIPRSCAMDQVCQNGECVREQICVPGETDCFDSNTLLTCRTSGLEYTSSPCPMETTCFDGTCASGDPVGTSCTDDTACVTNNCHCGSNTDEPCGSVTDGYCTSTSCTFESCGEDSLCVAGTLASLGNTEADYDHCVPRCTAGTCSAPFECRLLPVRLDGGIGWETGCYFPNLVDIGDECANDTQCAPGTCLQNFFDTGYCTRRCDADGACPEGSACVALRAGEFYCSLLCGDGSVASSQACPLDIPDDRFDVSCQILSKLDGGVARACTTP